MWDARSWLLAGLFATACSSKSEPPTVDPVVAKGTDGGVIAPAKPDDRYDSGSLGAIAFEVDGGTPAARKHFAHGLLAMHSFWYDEAVRQFDAAMAADPTMRMAYWGAAMARCKVYWGEDDISAARDILSKMPDPRTLPPKQQAWVMAAVALMGKGDVRQSRKWFVQAMEQLHAKFPDDESATFLALALISSTRPEDPDTLAVRKRAGELAAGVFQKNPKHPGAAHYLIHAYDMPELARAALPQAIEYAKIAPAAYHARHMPSHIFSRLGMWPEAIQSCHDAWDASLAAAKREKLTPDHHDFHSLNWIVEMNFELAHRKEADAALAMFGKAVSAGLGHANRRLYATQVASYMARTGEWARADELLSPLDAAPVVDPKAATLGTARTSGSGSHCAPGAAVSNEALVEQMFVVDARARAASRLGDVAKTQRYITEMDGIRGKLKPFFDATQPKDTIAKIEQSHARHRKALLARAAKNDRALLAALRESLAESEKETGGEMNPTGFLVREEVADVLLRLGQAREAAAEYAKVLAKHPRRGRALLQHARALAKAGDAKAARAAYEELLALWATAVESTDGLAEARAAVAAK